MNRIYRFMSFLTISTAKTLRANVTHDMYDGARVQVDARAMPCNSNGFTLCMHQILHINIEAGFSTMGDASRLKAG